MTPAQPTSKNDNVVPQVASAQPADGRAPIDGVAAVLGKIPSGLFVVTWLEQSQDRGMLASWVMQAGFQPPLIMIAIDRSRNLLTAIEQGSPFVVNVLGESQRGLLAKFGRSGSSGENPFAGLTIVRTPCGAAAIDGSVGWLECRCSGIPLGQDGEHAVVIATITAACAGSAEVPLVHLRRNGLRY